jgi:acyl carrier protein
MNGTVFETIKQILIEVCDVDENALKPEANMSYDLGIDSLAFLDLTFEVDQAFGIKVPLEEWTDEVQSGAVDEGHYFTLGGFCRSIEKLVTAQSPG